MEPLTTLILTVSIAIVLYYIFSRQKFKFPPGPVGYPLLGNSLDVDPQNLHLSFTKWAKDYGDIYQVSLFGKYVVVLNSAEIVRKALTVEPNATILADRMPSVLANDFLHGRSDIVFPSYSTAWSKRRKIGHKILKAYGEGLKSIETSVHEQLEITKYRVQDLHGNYFDPEEIINEFLAGIIAILLTGRRHDAESDFIKLLLAYDNHTNQLFSPGTLFLFDYILMLKYIPGPIAALYKKSKMFQNKLKEFFKIEKERSGNKGMVHHLYEEMESNPDDDCVLNENSISCILSNMVGAGILTSKGTLWSALKILLHRSDIQKMLQEEVDRVVGSERLPSVSDRSMMPYTEAFITETLRFISHVPLFIHHVSGNTQLVGYDIQKGSTVVVNAWNIHFNKEVYPEPFDFKPERFLDKDGNLLPTGSPQRRNFLAFGLGKRSCIGESFAKNRMFLFLATMMQTFSFVADDSSAGSMLNPMDMEASLIRMPKSFKCRTVLRNV